MALYKFERDGQTYDIEADSEQELNNAIKSITSQTRSIDDYPLWQRPFVAADDVVRMAARGATFGFSDELSAGLGALTGIGGTRGDYSGNLTAQRAADQAAADRSGLAGTAATAIGGIGAAIEAAPMTLSAQIPATANILSKVGAGTFDAGIMGGITGFGMGEGGFENRARNAAIDASISGTLGGIVGAASGVVPRILNSLADRRATRQGAQEAGIRPEVAGLLANTMAADQTLGATGSANMARAGNDAMLVDAGEASRGLLDTIIQSGGRGANVARDAVRHRSASAARALNNTLDASLGRVGELSGVPSTSLDPLYRKAYSIPINYTSNAGREIESMIKNRVPGSAIRAANDLMRVEGAESRQILAHIDDLGNVTGFERLPDVMQLDYITRGLNHVAETSSGLGALGGKTTLGRAYGNLARDIRTNLKSLVPEYAQALDAAGTEIGKVKATEFGATLFNPSVTRADVRDFTRGLPDIEKRYLMQSVRETIDERAAQTVRAITDGEMDAREAVKSLRDLSSRSNRQKVASVIGEEQAAPLFNELDRVATSFELRGRVAQGAQTASRLVARENMRNITAPGPVGQLMRGEPVQASRRIVQALTETTPRHDVLRDQNIAAEVADLLTRPASQSQSLFDALSRVGAQRQENLSTFGGVERGLSRRLGLVPGSSSMAIDNIFNDIGGRNARR